MAKWVKEEDSCGQMIWRNKKDKSLTVEAHKFDEEESKEMGAKWYVFPARDDRGIPNSPYLAFNKQDALKEINRLKKVM